MSGKDHDFERLLTDGSPGYQMYFAHACKKINHVFLTGKNDHGKLKLQFK